MCKKIEQKNIVKIIEMLYQIEQKNIIQTTKNQY